MNASVVAMRQRVCEALRSGRYKQGLRALRGADNSYCILGVLADVVDPAGWSAFPQRSQFYSGSRFLHLGEAAIPHPCLSAVGLDTEDARRLYAMNDHGVDFLALADMLEKMPCP